jgi:hypothetical protein
VDFRILGPLEVLDKGEALDLGGPKQRALLACLLVHARARRLTPAPEVTQAIRAGEIARCLRDENLAAVTGSGNARGAMHVDPDLSLVGHHRFARVQSHAHSDRSVSERFARRLRGGQRSGRRRKRHEERVSLCAYLDAAVTSELLAKHAMVLGQNVRVPIAELLQKPRRAFDVCAQERDGAMWKRHVRAHALDHSGSGPPRRRVLVLVMAAQREVRASPVRDLIEQLVVERREQEAVGRRS